MLYIYYNFNCFLVFYNNMNIYILKINIIGWENYSWGYHGDDGHSFCFSGTGKAYGPTFTTKDTIGCCINFMDMTVFYTKNGVNLGIAFRDIKNDHLYYPAIGLRTPGEVVEANFGQKKFKFDIENCIKVRLKK